MSSSNITSTSTTSQSFVDIVKQARQERPNTTKKKAWDHNRVCSSNRNTDQTGQPQSCFLENIEPPISQSKISRKLIRNNFQRDGFIIVPDVLSPNQCREMRDIIDILDTSTHRRDGKTTRRHIMHKCVFEQYPEQCLSIFKNDTILPIVKDLISMAGSSRQDDRSLLAHVIHNNAFKVPPGGTGQAARWHTDDPPLFSGELPPGVHMAPLVLTCM